MSQKMTMDIVTPIRGGEDTIKHEVDNCRAVPEISKGEDEEGYYMLVENNFSEIST